jgi:predicted nucleic acid-binding Zn ribbon protein
MSYHNTKSLGEAIREFITAMKWDEKINETSIIGDWEKIVGRIVQMHTTKIKLKDGQLTLWVDSSALRHELHMRKQQLIKRINDFYHASIVRDIVLR